jgi:hypothetical protein
MEGGRESARTNRAGRQGIGKLLIGTERRFPAPQRMPCAG